MNSTSTRRVVIYSRVSRDDTGEGKSNERQEEACRAYCQARGWQVVAARRDSASASTRKRRPGWSEVLDILERGEADGVVAWKLDRVSRNALETHLLLELFKEHGYLVTTVDGDMDLTTETGRAAAAMMATFAQLEVERKAARQKSANAQRRAAGLPWRSGWASFGYDRDKNVVPEQAEMIRKAAEDVLNGATLKGIAREWRASGVSTPRSSLGADGWTHSGVKSILLNPVNAGINTYRGEEIGDGTWEPILTVGTLRQLQALLTDSSRRTHAGNGRRAENLLSGVARCAVCDHTVHAGTSNGRKVYKCSNRTGEHVTTPREDADQFVLDAVTSTSDVFASHRVLPDVASAIGQDELVAEMASLDRRERAITQQFSEGALREQTWSAALTAIGQQRDALSERLASADGMARTQSALSKARISSFLALSLDDKRVTLKDIVDIRLHPRDGKRNVPIDRQVTVWARDARRLSPLVAGSHPATLAKLDEIIEQRDEALLAQLPENYEDQ